MRSEQEPGVNPFAVPPRAFDFAVTSKRIAPFTPGFDRVAFVIAFLLPPLGLVLSIAARLATRVRYGWTSRIAKAATIVSVILTIGLAIGGGVAWQLGNQASERAALVEQSTPLCELEMQNPGIFDDPTFGWPALGASVQESIDLMKAYESSWRSLASTTPASIAPQVTAIADAAAGVIAEVEASRIIDNAANITAINAVVATSTVPAWVDEYCG